MGAFPGAYVQGSSGIADVTNQDHSTLANLDYASAGHTEFAGTAVANVFTANQTIAKDAPAFTMEDTGGTLDGFFKVDGDHLYIQEAGDTDGDLLKLDLTNARVGINVVDGVIGFPLDVRGVGKFAEDGAGIQYPLLLSNYQAAAANVGVGINLLGIGATGMGTFQARWEGAATTDSYFALATRKTNVVGEKLRIASTGKISLGGAAASGTLEINPGTNKAYFQDYGGTDGELLTLDLANDRVGIAASSPTYTLDVRATSQFRQDGSSIQYPLYLTNNTAAAANLGTGINFLGAGAVAFGTFQARWETAATTDSYFSFSVRGSNSVAEAMRLTSTKNMIVAGDSIAIATTQSPASNGTGTTGEIAWDSSYIYVCINTNTWARAALTGGY